MEKFIKISKYHIGIIVIYILAVPFFWFIKPDIFQYDLSLENNFETLMLIIVSLAGFWIYTNYFKSKEIKINLHDLLSRVPFLVLYALFFAIPEEIIFRGIIQNYFEATLSNTQLAVVGASLIFGAVHLPNGASGASPSKWNWQFATIAFLGGLIFGEIYVLTGTLLLSTIVHTFFLFLLLLKATRR